MVHISFMIKVYHEVLQIFSLVLFYENLFTVTIVFIINQFCIAGMYRFRVKAVREMLLQA